MSSQLRIVILALVIVLPFAAAPAINASFRKLEKWGSQGIPEVPAVASDSNSQRVIEISHDKKGGVIKKEGVQVEQVQGKKGDAKVRDEQGVKDLVMSMDFWLYFWANACGVTLGMVYVYNLGRISQSRGNYEGLLGHFRLRLIAESHRRHKNIAQYLGQRELDALSPGKNMAEPSSHEQLHDRTKLNHTRSVGQPNIFMCKIMNSTRFYV